jgi:ABC-2 type transport system ATP-binding protein
VADKNNGFQLQQPLSMILKLFFLMSQQPGLDPQARRNLWDLVRSIRDKGTTVIITTHYMDEAEVLCDRVAYH